MTSADDILCTQVQHGSQEYLDTVRLREAVLRKPLGLAFAPGELAAEKDSFHLAAWREGRIIACLVLTPQAGGEVRLRQMAVAAACQRTGVGSRLVRFAEAFLADKGVREIVLHARDTAVGFYERLGYRTEGERFVEVGIAHWTMSKTLPQ